MGIPVFDIPMFRPRRQTDCRSPDSEPLLAGAPTKPEEERRRSDTNDSDGGNFVVGLSTGIPLPSVGGVIGAMLHHVSDTGSSDSGGGSSSSGGDSGGGE